MKFNLNIVPIEAKPKKGYYFIANETLYQVEEINLENKYKEVRGINILTGLKDDFPIEDISSSIAKFIATVKDKTYSIVNGDFSIIVQSLNQTVDSKDTIFNTLLECCIHGISITYDGSFEYYKSKITAGDHIVISSLFLVDKYKLYDTNDRVGSIVEYDNTTKKFKVKLNNSNLEFWCKREDIEHLTKSDKFIMVKIKCPYCNK